MPNWSGRKVARRIGHLGWLGRAGHCCCLMNQRPALVLTLAKSSPTLMARPRGPHGAVPAQLAPNLRLLRSVAVLAITHARISRGTLNSASAGDSLCRVGMSVTRLTTRVPSYHVCTGYRWATGSPLGAVLCVGERAVNVSDHVTEK